MIRSLVISSLSTRLSPPPPPLLRFPWPFFPLLGLFIRSLLDTNEQRHGEGEGEPSTKGRRAATAGPASLPLPWCGQHGAPVRIIYSTYTGREKRAHSTSSCLGSSSFSSIHQWLPSALCISIIIVAGTVATTLHWKRFQVGPWEGAADRAYRQVLRLYFLSSQRIGSNQHIKHFGKLTTVVLSTVLLGPCLVHPKIQKVF